MGSFVLAALHVHTIEIPYRAFPERVGPPRILSLETIDYFEISEQNFEVYWKNRIEDQGLVIENWKIK